MTKRIGYGAKMVDIIPGIAGIITTFPFNIILLIAVIGVIAYYIIPQIPRRDKEFEIEDFRESVFIYCKNIMDTFGIKSDSTLVKGIEPQGKLSKWYRYIGKFPKYEYNKRSKQLEPKKDVFTDMDFMIFQIGKKGFFDFIFGTSIKFVVIDKDFLSYDGMNKTFSIDEKISLVPYANTFIASSKAVDFLNNVSFQRSQEELLTYAQNYARKTAWLELAHAKTMDRIQGKIESKQANFDKYRADALKTPEDDEDE